MPKSIRNSEEEFEEFLFDFDREELVRFVKRLPKVVEGGLAKGQIDQINAALKGLVKGKKATLEFPVRFSGRDTRLIVSLHAMDEIEFPTLYLYSIPELIAEIEEELSRFVQQGPEEEL